MKQGFTLIELLIATMIASLISGLLLIALYQSGKVQVVVDNTINMSERIGIVVGQLEKDLAGAFVPTSAVAEAMADKQAEEKKDSSSAKASDSAKATSDTTADKDAKEKSGQKKEAKPIEKIFYATNKNDMLDTLTFVTNNPLVVFVGKDVGTVKPKVVRVQYTLKPDPENKESFILFRQESNELDLAEYKNVRPYEVIGGIKKLSVSYTARIEKKTEQKSGDQAADKKQGKHKKSYEYKVQPEWTSEKNKEVTKDAAKQDENPTSHKATKGLEKEQEFPRIPYSVEFKMTLWDKNNKKDKEFTFVCAIPVDSIEAQLNDKKEPEQQEQKPAPADSKQQGQQGQQAMRGGRVQTNEVVVYSEKDLEAALANAMDSLKKLLGHA